MPPIPVHIDDPITPQKPTGATPQTAQAQPPLAQEAAASTTATTTRPPYTPAAPGQAAVPAPTPFVPPQPTRTTQAAQDGPPPPQPGAVPVPPMQQVIASTLPPPPKPGEAAKAREASVTQLPPQMGIAAPVTNYAPTHSTSTIPPPGARTVNLGPVTAAAPASVPSARPEGYVQNASAQEMSATQRSSLEEQQRRESVFGNVSTAGGGIGGVWGSGDGGVGETAASAWSAVKGFMGTAGEKLAGAEEEVWKRINGGK